MTRHHERKADERQVASMRAEGHEAWDYFCDAHAEVSRIAKEMGRGYGSSTLGSGGGSSDMTPTERQALMPERLKAEDPATKASEALAHGAETFGHLRLLARAVRSVLPVAESDVAHLRGRVNAVEVCALCSQPAPEVKRIDGLPYHRNSCYFRAWRSGQGKSAGQKG